MKNFEDFIHDYLDNELPIDEKLAFEKELQKNMGLKEELKMQKRQWKVIMKHNHPDVLKLRENLQKAENQHRNKRESKKVGNATWTLLIAACLLVFFLINPFKNSDHTLYQLPEMHSEIVRGDAHEKALRYEEAVTHYKKGEFSQARQVLTVLLESDPENVQLQFYLAMTHYGEGAWKESVQELKPLSSGKSVFKEESLYYLAISQYRLGEKEEAFKTLDRIAPQSDYYKRVKKLKKMWGK